MQVAGQSFRTHIKEAFKVPHLQFIVFKRFQILQVADMLAEESVFALSDAEAGLLLGPAGKDLCG